jgi:hypothetical protein
MQISYDGRYIHEVKTTKFLGPQTDNRLNWKSFKLTSVGYLIYNIKQIYISYSTDLFVVTVFRHENILIRLPPLE